LQSNRTGEIDVHLISKQNKCFIVNLTGVETIKKVQDEIINEFIVFDDWMDRYNYLIELSNELPLIDDKLKKNDYVIRGCQSKVWLNAEFIDGKIVFTADSDAIITKGIVALLIRVLSNRTPKEIMEADLEFIEIIGLRQNLSPTRANGLLAMIKQMKLFAIAYDAREKNN
jgi:cysteine desulfuration protein SufE